MSKYYQNPLWQEFRQNLIELDGNKCAICGRSGDDVVLQIHHKKYIKGRKPWECAFEDCITICKGCHAAEHGIIMPKHGWEYIDDEDLGDLCGICDNCNSELRYAFHIYHEKWGFAVVGTTCCDNLTDTEIASNLVESKTRFEGRKTRFFQSKRWKTKNGEHYIKQNSFEIYIKEDDTNYFIRVNAGGKDLSSKKKYDSMKDAKNKVFEILENGELFEYCKKHNIHINVMRKNTLINKSVKKQPFKDF